MGRNEALAKEICKILNGSSYLFFVDEQMYISKFINGEWITRKGMKDRNYNGNRYIQTDLL